SGGSASTGTDYWVAYPSYISPGAGGAGSGSRALSITAVQDTTGILTIPGLGYSTNFSVQANQAVTLLLLPPPYPNYAVRLNATDGIENKGIHITATHPISVFTAGPNDGADGTRGLPTPTLGQDYVVMAYANARSQAVSTGP